MWDGSGRHAELAAELIEWWEDLWQRDMLSRVVLVAVPPGWGRSAVLNRLAEVAARDDAPVTLIARVNGRQVADKVGLEAAALRKCLAEAADSHRVLELLGMDRLGGSVQMGIGVGSLFVSGMAAAAGFLVAGVALAAAGKAWDNTPAGQDGAVARAARAVASMSARVPVVVIIDDADCLDEGLALTLIENLTARRDGHVLVAAAVNPDGSLKAALATRARTAITPGVVHFADADPDMGFESRSDLVRELCLGLPEAAVRRIAHGTLTFKDILAVANSSKLAEISANQDEAEILAAVDTVLAAQLEQPELSREAEVIAWAGGLLHARQAGRALIVLGAERTTEGDRHVLRWEGLERLTDPASPHLAAKVDALAITERRAMAVALLDEALAIVGDSGYDVIDRVAAAQAAHRTRSDLTSRDRLPAVQRELTAALEQLGEPAAARDIAVVALEEWPPGGRDEDRDWLVAAVLRLPRLTPQESLPPGAARLVNEAISSGAVTGLEARIWAAVGMLSDHGQRETALAMVDQAAADLDTYAEVLGEAGTRWRLLLAFHAGQVGHPAIAARVLAPLLNSGEENQENAARAVLRASGGPRADTRLQNIILEAELAALSPGADDDRLRVHHVLASNYAALGQYRQAFAHGLPELDLRLAIQGPKHPDTLATRSDVAFWTGKCGDTAEALRLLQALLPDYERLLGTDHPGALSTRRGIAYWTGEQGNPREALRLARGLLPDYERVLGSYHPSTLSIRNDILSWTAQSGDIAEGLRLAQALLPDQERVLGAHHPSTLTTRSNIAHLTGRRGNKVEALMLSMAVRPDYERVFGADHPDTLSTRSNIAMLAGECGDTAGALRLFKSLLPDRERVLGADHYDTLDTRYKIALLTGLCDGIEEALRLLEVLLSDQERVLGSDHISALATQSTIASWIAQNGDVTEALRLFRQLLPDYERALGTGHRVVICIQNNIEALAELKDK